MKLFAGLVLVALAATFARAGNPATKATKASKSTKTGSTPDTGIPTFMMKNQAGSLEVNTLQSFEDDGSR